MITWAVDQELVNLKNQVESVEVGLERKLEENGWDTTFSKASINFKGHFKIEKTQ